MCYGAESVWVPAVIAAVGAGANAYQQHQVAKDQDQQAAINIAKQAEDQRAADQQVQKSVNDLRESSPDAARQQAAQAFVEQIQRARAGSTQSAAAGGSSRYKADTMDANSATDAATQLTTNNMAAIRGAQLQRTQEGEQQSQLGSVLGTMARNSAADQFLGELRLRGISANPWASAGIGVLSGLGEGLASNMGVPKAKKKASASDPYANYGASNVDPLARNA